MSKFSEAIKDIWREFFDKENLEIILFVFLIGFFIFIVSLVLDSIHASRIISFMLGAWVMGGIFAIFGWGPRD